MTLPEFLSEETEETIRNRMLSRLPSTLDRSEGSFPYDVLEPPAIELAQAVEWAKELLRRSFASTTFGMYLDERCAEHGVFRRMATPARSPGDSIRFRGDPGSSVPIGYIISTESTESTPAILYQTTSAHTLSANGEGFVEVVALEPGRSGNVPIGAIKHLTTPLSGITEVTNLTALSGGTDEESDEALRERFYLKVRTPTGSGNESDYKQWALSVAGVGDAEILPLWAGSGTVKVVLLDESKRAASSVIVDAVESYILSVRPIGATVTVAPATEIPIDISVAVTLASDVTLEQVQELIESSVQAYLQSLAFEDRIVRYTRIANIILDIPPVIDYQDLTVNGGDSNIEITKGEVAVVGAVVVNEV